MLKAMFDIFEPTERQLTQRAISRLRLASVIGFFAMPLVGIAQLAPLTGGLNTAVTVLSIIACLAMVYCLLTRLANRLWVPEKYLDESEIELKRRSASLTYQILMLVIAGLIAGMAFVSAGTPAAMDITLSCNLVLLTLGSLLIGAGCLQTGLAAWMTKPIDAEGTAPSLMDKRYGLFIIVFLMSGAAVGALLGHFG